MQVDGQRQCSESPTLPPRRRYHQHYHRQHGTSLKHSNIHSNHILRRNLTGLPSTIVKTHHQHRTQHNSFSYLYKNAMMQMRIVRGLHISPCKLPGGGLQKQGYKLSETASCKNFTPSQARRHYKFLKTRWLGNSRLNVIASSCTNTLHTHTSLYLHPREALWSVSAPRSPRRGGGRRPGPGWPAAPATAPRPSPAGLAGAQASDSASPAPGCPSEASTLLLLHPG